MAEISKTNFLLCQALRYHMLYENGDFVEADIIAKDTVDAPGTSEAEIDDADWKAATCRIENVLEGLRSKPLFRSTDVTFSIFFATSVYAADSDIGPEIQPLLVELASWHWNHWKGPAASLRKQQPACAMKLQKLESRNDSAFVMNLAKLQKGKRTAPITLPVSKFPAWSDFLHGASKEELEIGTTADMTAMGSKPRPTPAKRAFLLHQALWYQMLYDHWGRPEASKMAVETTKVVGDIDWYEARSRVAYFFEHFQDEPPNELLGDFPDDIRWIASYYATSRVNWLDLQQILEEGAAKHWAAHTMELLDEHDRTSRGAAFKQDAFCPPVMPIFGSPRPEWTTASRPPRRKASKRKSHQCTDLRLPCPDDRLLCRDRRRVRAPDTSSSLVDKLSIEWGFKINLHNFTKDAKTGDSQAGSEPAHDR
ncbi:unnamed protein product [Zymoseptoria tritici ST99CH_1A5]|uniref:Uncharacterized protein n=1 Tax=Zymoseptoria tritici ST99CH_1A5 TaxID=1276529 RepID=A0A1Y6LRU5_ZYMTR|nr:unnamed protein product [Zymoseptoria tritici ST99CH_1A5]